MGFAIWFTSGTRTVTAERSLAPPKGQISSEFVTRIWILFFSGGKSFFCKNYLLPKGYAHVNRVSLLVIAVKLTMLHVAHR